MYKTATLNAQINGCNKDKQIYIPLNMSLGLPRYELGLWKTNNARNFNLGSPIFSVLSNRIFNKTLFGYY
jgi:hypothetical protein